MRRSKLLTVILSLLIGFVLLSLGRTFADTTGDDEKWHQERDRRFELIEREKALLGQSDALSKEIFNLKRAMNELYSSLTSRQQDYQNVNHELISVQMKLIK